MSHWTNLENRSLSSALQNTLKLQSCLEKYKKRYLKNKEKNAKTTVLFHSPHLVSQLLLALCCRTSKEINPGICPATGSLFRLLNIYYLVWLKLGKTLCSKCFKVLKTRKHDVGPSAEECPKPRQLWALWLHAWILFAACSEGPAQLQDRPPGPGDKWQVTNGRWQMLCLAPRAWVPASHRQGDTSGQRWTQGNKSVGWQVWQSHTYTAISTRNEKTKSNIAGLWDRMNHPTSNHSQTQGASFSPPFSFPPTLSSYLMPLSMLIKPAFPRSWFNSLTQQESNPAIKRLNRFLLAFITFESGKEGLGST